MAGAGSPVAMLAVAFLVALLWPSALQAKVCSVADYGAKGDGKANDTKAFVQAFAACAYNDSQGDEVNTVLVPQWGEFLTWPLVVKDEQCSYVAFTVLGKMVPPSDPSSWAHTYNKSFLLFQGCKSLLITGGGQGMVDGKGEEWWKAFEDHGIERPHLIIVSDTDGLNVTDITFIDSPNFHLVPEDSQHILIANIKITAPGDSPNTDGIDPSNSQHITIRNCNISTGDDNVALKPGTNDVLIENCWFGRGHGCSMGSINSTGVWDVVVRNIMFVGTDNGARIKTWQGGTGKVENVTYSALRLEEVGLPIDVNMYYCPHSTCKNSSKGAPSIPAGIRYRVIQFVN